MVVYLALGVLLLIGLLAVGHWVANANARLLVRVLVGVAVAFAIGGGIFLALTGRLLPAVVAGLPLLPFVWRWMAQRQRARSYAGPRPGQGSSVETPTLRAYLDHESGQVTGEVRTGQFAGRSLESLDRGELVALLNECRIGDLQAAAILEAYLDRVHPDWRAAAGAAGPEAGPEAGPAPEPSPPGGMSRTEAYAVLGLEPGADETAIRKAHRDLIRRMHPDQGGSTYLAAKINRAKDILLGVRA
ncbi:MAG: DnaJ domain-containing protein [Alphaproteobacteria bacterium]